ncbi:preprotein translocase subunit SecG [Limimonas halophila]|uniref:Protein-export membrane protein SecG n=1 Tax=Limimonas halophila TaxID=1082479 RepID=A0A1G7ND09_9PROT|nr:preprotein translocase subunit SecG [Limimonas halophila]SDF71219.1 preprotein translocase subunit SecG [Limimonas halophila]
MTTVLLVIHLLIAIAMIIIVLLQPSEGGLGGLGGGGGGGGAGGGLGALMSSRGAATVLTRATAVLAACFMATSIALTIFAGGNEASSVLEEVPAESGSGAQTQEAPAADGEASGASGDGQPSSDQPEVPVE